MGEITTIGNSLSNLQLNCENDIIKLKNCLKDVIKWILEKPFQIFEETNIFQSNKLPITPLLNLLITGS